MSVAWDWFAANTSVFNLLVNLGMLLVWGIYLDLILRSHRRARRFKILISIGGRDGLGARCLITNLSAEPVYVVRVWATVTTGEDRWSSAVTEYGALGEDTPLNPERMTRQGPLLTGHWRDIGSLFELFDRARGVRGEREPMDQLDTRHLPSEVELTVAALYGSGDIPVGARRRFTVTADEDVWRVEPATPDTEQIRDRRSRRQLLADY